MKGIIEYYHILRGEDGRAARFILQGGMMVASALVLCALVLTIISYPVSIYNYDLYLNSRFFTQIGLGVGAESVVGAIFALVFTRFKKN